MIIVYLVVAMCLASETPLMTGEDTATKVEAALTKEVAAATVAPTVVVAPTTLPVQIPAGVKRVLVSSADTLVSATTTPSRT